MRVLITGGAGFVGSNLAVMLATAEPGASVVAFDNLHRRGSELTLPRLREHGVGFVHGDVRSRADVLAVGDVDVLVECSAEPSVHAGASGDADYLVATNLIGTVNCLEAARRSSAAVIFLSTSRVYPIPALRSLPLARDGDRLDVPEDAEGAGWSHHGIARTFPLEGHRSLYGATKLASELLIEEYRQLFGIRAVINRCGVIAGPWQMGKVDQGFVALWAARHLWGTGLEYTGFGGEGLQVRDVLHVADVFDLVRAEMAALDALDGRTFNVGGGFERSVSLRELTGLAAARAGRTIPIGSSPSTAPADVPYYVTDNREATEATGWQPQRSLDTVLDDVFAWLRAHESSVRLVLS